MCVYVCAGAGAGGGAGEKCGCVRVRVRTSARARCHGVLKTGSNRLADAAPPPLPSTAPLKHGPLKPETLCRASKRRAPKCLSDSGEGGPGRRKGSWRATWVSPRSKGVDSREHRRMRPSTPKPTQPQPRKNTHTQPRTWPTHTPKPTPSPHAHPAHAHPAYKGKVVQERAVRRGHQIPLSGLILGFLMESWWLPKAPHHPKILRVASLGTYSASSSGHTHPAHPTEACSKHQAQAHPAQAPKSSTPSPSPNQPKHTQPTHTPSHTHTQLTHTHPAPTKKHTRERETTRIDTVHNQFQYLFTSGHSHLIPQKWY